MFQCSNPKTGRALTFAGVEQGTPSASVNHGRRHGDRTGADNWAGDSEATKQHGLGNEINDVVLGLVSLRRGLSAQPPQGEGKDSYADMDPLCGSAALQNRVRAPSLAKKDKGKEVNVCLNEAKVETLHTNVRLTS